MVQETRCAMHTNRLALAAGHAAAVIALAAAIVSPVRGQMAKPEDYPPPKPAFASVPAQ